MSVPLVSLCMPTNGVSEWVFPVLKSIYGQGVPMDLYEVIITDNGTNARFKSEMQEYLAEYPNIHYAETQALPFLNEIEAYKRANGQLIKFINHRTLLLDGTLQHFIDLALNFKDQKPIIYFANGVLKKEHTIYEYNTFDLFVKNLSYWSSWSTGMTIWKEDFAAIENSLNGYNELFPHTDILFADVERAKYVIDNTVIFNEIPAKNKAKGNYDLFYAFGVEYPALILGLYRAKRITIETYKQVTKDNLTFVASLFYMLCIRKRYCSYDLSGIRDMYGIFYTRAAMIKCLCGVIVKAWLSKILRIVRKKQ